MNDRKTYIEKAEILKALAHPARLEIMIRLKQEGCNVTEIQNSLGLPQSTISQHLKILKNVGLIENTRSANTVCYTVLYKEMNALIDILKMI